MTRFLVVGAPRSGTGYVRHLLRAAGVNAGHENVYGVIPCADPPWEDWQADCSWLAVPELPQVTVPVALVTRHPMAVAASLVRLGVFADDRGSDLYTTAIYGWRPEVAAERDAPARALATWVHFTVAAMTRAAYVTSLEALADPHMGGEELAGLLRAVGAGEYADNAARAAAMVAAAGEEVRNAKPDETRYQWEPSWDAMPRPLASTARLLAVPLGYHNDRWW